MNTARFQFLGPRATDRFPARDVPVRTTVSLPRTEAGRNPYDKGLSGLIGELATRGDEFRTAGAAHNARLHPPASRRP